MTSSSASYLQFVKDQLFPLRNITCARFFGGTGFSSDATQFAMLIENTLYFVVDDKTRAKYEAMGSYCFSYQTKKRRVQVKKYYAVPVDILEDQEQLIELAQEAIQVARQSTSLKSAQTSKKNARKIDAKK